MTVRPPRALVTGGAGFIGSHVVEALLARGWSARVFDDFSSGLRENLSPAAEICSGDIRDRKAVEQATRGCQRVFHLAALGSVPRSMKNPDQTHDVNVAGTYNLFLAARATGVERIVFFSSSSIYGDDPRIPKSEDQIGRTLSPYAASKRANEHEDVGFAPLPSLRDRSWGFGTSTFSLPASDTTRPTLRSFPFSFERPSRERVRSSTAMACSRATLHLSRTSPARTYWRPKRTCLPAARTSTTSAREDRRRSWTCGGKSRA